MSVSYSIDRSSLSLSALVLGAQDGTGGLLALTELTDPALQPRVAYAPASRIVHGDTSLGWSWQQTLLSFEVAPFGSSGEQETQAAIDELVAAITQSPRFELTRAVGNADPRVWLCDPGSIAPVGNRTYVDLRDADPVWRVAIPCSPVWSVA